MTYYTYYGTALMISAGLPLLGVLAELRHRALAAFHATLRDDPLAPARTRLQRRHLTRPCPECSLLAELATAHVQPLARKSRKRPRLLLKDLRSRGSNYPHVW